MRRFSAVLLALGLAVAHADPCEWTDEASGAAFDLSALNTGLSQQYGWRVRDSRNNAASGNYTYTFNVCGNLDRSIFKQQEYTACNVTYDHPSNLPNDRLAGKPTPVLQTANFPVQYYDKCHRLGRPVNDTNARYSLLDASNPARGVRLTYWGGDSCGAEEGERTFTVALQCADHNDRGPGAKEVVLETDACDYEVSFKSVYGCPLQCPVVGSGGSGGRLCNGNGVCDFDRSANKARCFCFQGWAGAACDSRPAPAKHDDEPAVSGYGVGLIIACIVMLFAGVLLWALWSKVRSLRLDMSAYRTLAGDYEVSSALPEGDAGDK